MGLKKEVQGVETRLVEKVKNVEERLEVVIRLPAPKTIKDLKNVWERG